jgi:N-terminal half of MaoC dehydratase
VIDRKYIGHAFPPYTVEVEKGRLRFFAKAIGEKNPIYTDEAAATPIPPTFLFSLENEVPEPFGWLTPMGVHFENLLHGEQSFKYHAMVYAGDRVTFAPRIADIYDKKNGALEFIVKETRVTNASGGLVAELRSVLVVRHG